MVEDHVTQATESQHSLLKKAANILRTISVNFRQSKDIIFKGYINVDNDNATLELETSFKWLLARIKDLNATITDQIKCLAGSISQNILYNIEISTSSGVNSKSKDLYIREKLPNSLANATDPGC